MKNAQAKLVESLTVETARFDKLWSEERRARWWRHLVEAEPDVPDGAQLTGWDTRLAASREEEESALRSFQARPNILAVSLNLHEAWELGLCEEATDHGADEPDDDAEFPCVVAALRWAILEAEVSRS
ncbi:hypothetical protein HNR23_002282 [Nocardiopsis mwathae]|uniref:Uncharacterized protein n=1 Tax=Nocardiopsis mwathae TaxID=1472723 RepID=A0A7W9YHH7_9ACTN|nr:hypothetical protein [Nocardiopsis mwathae]MBB6172222.1 hypothetical protein [Nocardiopsis mwathae]